MAETEQVTLDAVFKNIDTDSSGYLSIPELKEALAACGLGTDTFEKILAEADSNQDGKITEEEFKKAMTVANEKGGKVGELNNLVKAQKQMLQVKTESGGLHTYAHEELEAFTEHLNSVLEGDPDLADKLPVSTENEDLFNKVGDGLILASFINCIKPDTIDRRALNIPKPGKTLTVFKVNENLNLVINAAKSIGVQVHNIGCNDISKVTNPSLALGLLWQMVKMHLLSDINLKEHPELLRLLREGETMADLLGLSPEEILKRWMNYHLEAAGSDKRIRNFGSDVKNSEAYAIVMNQIGGDSKCPKSRVMDHDDKLKRAEGALANARALGCKPFIKAKDIKNGNQKLNLAFVADLFNTAPGLEELKEEDLDKFGLEDEDPQGEREEVAFRTWANNLGIDDFYLYNLFEGLEDGVNFLKIIDAVKPGTVIWKKVEMPKLDKKTGEPKKLSVFKKNNNNTYAIKLLKSLGLSIVGIGGVDITQKNKKLILGCIWQLFRYHCVQFLASMGDVTDKKILDTANGYVEEVGGTPLKSFKDPDGGTGVWACNLVKSIKPEVFDDEFVSAGHSEEDARLNARYAISVARKHDILIFVLPEDIMECKKKMVMTFAAAIVKKRS